jgi:long-chain acyl-CoA synthetase
VVVIQGYGLTEAGPVIASQTPNDSLAGLAGRIVGGWQHRIDRGRLWVRGRHIMNGYLWDPAATSVRIDPDGWLDTGDLVERDDETEQLRILGRADDRIVLSNGHVVDPLAIETRLTRIPGIATAVVARTDDGRGIEWWLEPHESSAPLPPLRAVVETLPAWERPRRIRSFQVSPAERQSVFNRKGAVRRGPMLRLLRRSDSFRDHA